MAPKRHRQDVDRQEEHRRARLRTSESPVAGPSSTPARRAPSPQVVVPRHAPANRLHNIHPIGRHGEIEYCRDESCNRCSDFDFLASRAQREFGCILVRPDSTSHTRIDNDDDDPTQPTYRQDNAAFDMICRLEEEKQGLQTEMQRLKKRQQDDAAEIGRMQADIDKYKKAEKETAALKRQLTLSKNQVSDLKCQVVGSRTLGEENTKLLAEVEELRTRSNELQQSVDKAERKAARKAARKERARSAVEGATEAPDATSTQRESEISPLHEEPFEGEPFDPQSFHAATLESPTPPEPRQQGSHRGLSQHHSRRQVKSELPSAATSNSAPASPRVRVKAEHAPEASLPHLPARMGGRTFSGTGATTLTRVKDESPEL